MRRFICNDSPTASVALLINYATAYHPAKTTKKRDVYFKSKNMYLIIHEASALMARSTAVQSSIQGVSGCSAPAGPPPGGDVLRENQTPNRHTCPLLVHGQCIRHRARLHTSDCHTGVGFMKSALQNKF